MEIVDCKLQEKFDAADGNSGADIPRDEVGDEPGRQGGEDAP